MLTLLSQLRCRTTHDRRRFAAAAAELLDGVCTVQGCRTGTTGSKPYCVTHLDRLPYVKKLRAELARREAEVSSALRRRSGSPPDPRGSQAQEIVSHLAQTGRQTVERLRLHVRLPKRAVESYVRALELAGLVRVETVGSRRGGVRRLVVPAALAG